LNQGPTEQVEPTLKEILLGPEEEPFPRKDLPAEILTEIDAFVSLVGRRLTEDEQEEMASLALAIYLSQSMKSLLRELSTARFQTQTVVSSILPQRTQRSLR
jgi:hypothetical protein